MENFDVKANFLVYDGVVWCIKLLRNALENQNEKKKKQKFQHFVENFIKVPIDWHTKSWSALNTAAPGKASRNGVLTAAFSAPEKFLADGLHTPFLHQSHQINHFSV